MPVFIAHYGESPYKTCLYGDFFKFVRWWAREQYFHHRDQCTKPSLRSDMDPNVPERLLRP